MPRPPLGEQQLDLLRFVSEHSPITAREVAEQYGEPNGLARTTVVTVLEKLRQKGYLTRAQVDGVYQYSPASGPAMWQDVIHQFVERTLGGRLGPFVAYLTNQNNLTPEEIQELEELVKKAKQQNQDK